MRVTTDVGLPTTLKSGWIKRSTIRSNEAILALTAVINGLASWAVANFVTEVFAFATVFTAVFGAVAGILIFSSQAQH